MLQQIRIDVRLPEGHWAGDVTRAHPSATLRIEEQMAMTKGRGTATCWCDEILENSLLLHEGIDDYLGMEEGQFSVNISRGGGGFIRPLLDMGILPQTPFEVVDGWVEWTIKASKGDIWELIEQIKKQGLPHRLKSKRSSKKHLLTQRQREVFEVALREGYWDVPRRINLTELASILGVAKSTLSSQLQRIESSVFHAFQKDIRRQST